MKKFTALICLLMMLLNISVVCADNPLPIKVEAEDKVSGSSVSVFPNFGTGSVISMSAGGSATYSVALPEDGMYDISITYASPYNATITATMETELSQEFAATGTAATYLRNFSEVSFGTVAMRAGEKTLVVTSNVSVIIDFITITYTAPFEEGLEEDNKIEAESANDPKTVVSGGSGEVCAVSESSPLSFDINAYAEDVYRMYINCLTSNNANIEVYLNDKKITERSISAFDEYKSVYFGYIRIPEGRSIIKIVSTADLKIDFFELNKNVTQDEAQGIIFEAENYDASSGNITAAGGGAGRYISFSSGKYVSFNTNISTPGKYKFIANGAVAPDNGYPYSTIGVYLGAFDEKEELCSGNINITANWTDFQPNTIGAFMLPEGDVTITVAVIYAASHINNFELIYMGEDCEIDKALIGDEILANNTHASRGADSIEVSFTQNVSKDSVNNETVKLISESEEYPLVYMTENNVIKANLSKSLDYSAEYRVVISGVCDEFGEEIEECEFVFTSDGEDVGSASITDIKSTINYDDVKVTGVMNSSKDIPISGREAYLTFGANTVSAISDENGEFVIDFVVPAETNDGMITVYISGEYVGENHAERLLFVKKTTEEQILDDIKESTTAEAVGNIFSANAEALALNLSIIIGHADAADVYAHMVGAEFLSHTELTDALLSYAALEKINAAENKDQIEAVIYDSETAELLGLNSDMINAVSVNKDSLLNDILALPVQSDISDLKTAAEDVIQKWACIEFGKNTAVPLGNNVSIYVGEGAQIPLGFSAPQSDVCKVTFKITCSSSDMAQNIIAQCDLDGTFEDSTNGNVWSGVFMPTEKLSDVTRVGKVTLGALPGAGTYTASIEIAVTYDIDKPFSLIYKPSPLAVNVSVEQKIQNSQGTGSSSQSGSRPQTGGKAELPPIAKPTEPSQTKYSFSDVSKSYWAHDYIYGLLEKGIVSESEDKKFNSEANIKREEFVKMLVLSTGIYDETLKCTFTDANESAWYYSYLGSAQSAGVVLGRDDGTFGIGEYISREEMATLIYRAANLSKAENYEKFTDYEDISEFAVDAVYSMQQNGIINGMDDGSFNPKGLATRAQCAKMIYLMMEAVK